jgi:hypothetical protein
MAKDPNKIVLAGTGTVMVAPKGTAAPADIAAAWPAGWLDTGYTNEDGVKATKSRTVAEKNVWQSFYPVRRLITAEGFRVEFGMAEWSKVTWPLAMGGGVITTDSAGKFRYTPPDPGDGLDEKALGVDFNDGDKNYRLIILRGIAADSVEVNLAKKNTTDLPVAFDVLGTNGVAPWVLLTDDPAFNPA